MRCDDEFGATSTDGLAARAFHRRGGERVHPDFLLMLS